MKKHPAKSKYGLPPDEAEFLKELEAMVISSERFPAHHISRRKLQQIKCLGEFQVLEEIKSDSVGILIQNNHLIGLGLFRIGLISLPENIEHLTYIKYFKVSWNDITSLPKNISQLTHLEELEFYVNQISVFPEEITELVQ